MKRITKYLSWAMALILVVAMGATMTGCSAASILGGGKNDSTQTSLEENMKEMLISFIEVHPQPEIEKTGFLDKRVLQIGNHVVTFPCTLSEFMEMSDFSTEEDLSHLMSAGETATINGILDGSEYSLTCNALNVQNISTSYADALVDQQTISSVKYGNKAFIYPGNIRPYFTTAKDLENLFGTPSHVVVDDPNAGGYFYGSNETDASQYDLIYEYYLKFNSPQTGNGYSNNTTQNEIGVNYYINRQSGLVTKIEYTEGMDCLVTGTLVNNGYGILQNNNIIPTFDKISTTEDVDGNTIIWTPNGSEHYAVSIYTEGSSYYSGGPLSDSWYKDMRSIVDGVIAAQAQAAESDEETAANSSALDAYTAEQKQIVAEYRAHVGDNKEEVYLLRLDGYTVISNESGYVGYKITADDSDKCIYQFFCDTDIRENTGYNDGIVYLCLQKAQRTYGDKDSARLTDTEVIQSFKDMIPGYAQAILEANS